MRITTSWMKKLVDEVGSTLFYKNLCRIFATVDTITKVDRPVNFTIFHCMMSSL